MIRLVFGIERSPAQVGKVLKQFGLKRRKTGACIRTNLLATVFCGLFPLRVVVATRGDAGRAGASRRGAKPPKRRRT